MEKEILEIQELYFYTNEFGNKFYTPNKEFAQARAVFYETYDVFACQYTK